jgi:Terminase large subunit, ATPase domain
MSSDAARPDHGSLVYRGAQKPERLVALPPWSGWRPSASEATRAKRFLRRHVVVPTGTGAAAGFRIARFQCTIIDTLYDNLACFVSLPTSNGKTTLLAGLALERLTRGDAYAEIDVLATKQEQAGLLVNAARQMVECSPELARRCRWHVREGMLEYLPTGSVMRAHPAKVSAIQGLNYSLAILDEVGFVQDEVMHSMLARLGKRPDARLIGIGTPGFEPNVLHEMRLLWKAGELPPGVAFLEWSAKRTTCAVTDRRAWRQANPALAAGFLQEGALEVQAKLLPERQFRVYHLGLWVDQSAPWLPPGAWDDCPDQGAPPAGAEVVLAVEGTFRRSAAVIGATMDGAVFHVWSAEVATDGDLRRAVELAAEKWEVRAVTYPRRIRPRLFAELLDEGLPIEPWDRTMDNEATASNEFFRAVVGSEGVTLAHDHSAHIAEQMLRVRARYGLDGSIRLARPEDGTNVDSAIGTRSAWWRARQLADEPVGALVIY